MTTLGDDEVIESITVARRSASERSGILDGDAGATGVEVTSEIELAGALAQFGKAAVMQEVASRITDMFVRNFEQRLSARGEDRRLPAGAPEGMAAEDTRRSRPLDAGSLAWAILRDRIMAFLRRLVGRQPP